jgi:hypothetical protein
MNMAKLANELKKNGKTNYTICKYGLNKHEWNNYG